MAQRIALHYIPGNSPLHRWDARCKFLWLCVVMVTLFQTDVLWLGINTLFLLGLLVLARLPLGRIVRDSRIWMIFLAMLFFFQVLFTPGPRLFVLPWISISHRGLYTGFMSCWRLGLILTLAVLFTAVTRPRELRDTVIWCLKPFPFLPERRIALMVSLTLRFFSVALDQMEEVNLAHKARLGDQRKNPLVKAKYLVLPLLRRSFSRAEDVTHALYARGYQEDSPLQLPQIPLLHWLPLLIYSGFLILVWSFE